MFKEESSCDLKGKLYTSETTKLFCLAKVLFVLMKETMPDS